MARAFAHSALQGQHREVGLVAGTGGRYTSGDWRVKDGNEPEFIKRWTEFVTWAKESASGANEFFLIQQDDAPQHFISFGNWDDQSSVDAWRQSPEFAERLERCRELCDSFQANDFQPVAYVGG
jgi:heme-degrading monooxygenase HmoA